MTLQELVEGIESAEKTASINADEPQYARTRSGILSSIGAAKTRLDALKRDYANSIMTNGVAIFLYGPANKTDEFIQLVQKLNGAVVVDGAELYKRIASVVEPAIGRDRRFGTTQTAIMHRVIGEISKELNVWVSRAMKLPSDVVLADANATLDFVRTSVRDQMGDDMNLTFLKNAIAREALKIRYKDPVAPVLLSNLTPEESVGIGMVFGRGRANIELTENETIDEEFIKKTFKNIQKNLKKPIK